MWMIQVALLIAAGFFLCSALFNFAIWRRFKKRDVMREALRFLLRQELLVNQYVGLGLFTATVVIWAATSSLSSAIPFRMGLFFAYFGLNLIPPSVTLQALHRYLAVSQPQNWLVEMKNVNFILWPLVALYTLPEIFAYQVPTTDGYFGLEPWGVIFKRVDEAVLLAIIFTYYVFLHLAGTMSVPAGDSPQRFVQVQLLHAGYQRVGVIVHPMMALVIILSIAFFFISAEASIAYADMLLLIWRFAYSFEAIFFAVTPKDFTDHDSLLGGYIRQQDEA